MKATKRHLAVGFLSMALAAGALSIASAKDEKAATAMKPMKPVTVEGILIDTKCYGMNNDNITNDHMTPNGTMPACGTACANMGIPVGLLVDGKKGGRVLVLLTSSKGLADHVGGWARVTGANVLGEGTLLPEKTEVKGKDGKYAEIKIGTMM